MKEQVDLACFALDESRNMQKFTFPFEAVLFDMDGTLIDTERLGAASWDHAGEETGLFVSEEVKQAMVGRNLEDISRIVKEALPDDDVDPLLERANFHYHRLVTETVPPIKSGAKELLDWLAEKRVPMALATSSNSWQAEDKLGRTGLRDYFSFLIGGDQLDRGKPDPEIFHRAAEGLGVRCDHCVVFEDSEPGIQAANRSGAKAVLIPEFWPTDPSLTMFADEVFQNLVEAKAWLMENVTAH